MKSSLAKEVISQLKTSLPELKHVGRYNNQFANWDKINPIGLPCALVETRDFIYTDGMNGLQRYVCIVRVYLGFESYKSEEFGDMDLSTKVFQSLHKFSPTEHTPLMRIAESVDSDSTNVYLPYIDFRTGGAETWTPATDKTVSNLALETSTDLMIENPATNKLRTGQII